MAPAAAQVTKVTAHNDETDCRAARGAAGQSVPLTIRVFVERTDLTLRTYTRVRHLACTSTAAISPGDQVDLCARRRIRLDEEVIGHLLTGNRHPGVRRQFQVVSRPAGVKGLARRGDCAVQPATWSARSREPHQLAGHHPE